MVTAAPPALSLSKAVQIASKVTAMHGGPNTWSILLKPSRDGVRVIATNFEVWVDVTAAGTIKKPALVTASVLKGALAGAVKPVLAVEGTDLLITSEFAEWRLRGYKASEYPELPEMADAEEVVFSRDHYLWCAQDAAKDDSRPILTGVAVRDGFTAAADGFRLRYSGAPASNTDRVVIPAIAPALLPTHITSVVATKTHVRIHGDWTLTTQRIQGVFPSFETMAPKSFEWRCEYARADMQTAIRQLVPILKQGSGIVRLLGARDGGIALSSSAEEFGSARITVPADVSGDFKIALNGLYLEDAMKTACERVVMSGNDPKTQLCFDYGEDRHEIIMPMYVPW